MRPDHFHRAPPFHPIGCTCEICDPAAHLLREIARAVLLAAGAVAIATLIAWPLTKIIYHESPLALFGF